MRSWSWNSQNSAQMEGAADVGLAGRGIGGLQLRDPLPLKVRKASHVAAQQQRHHGTGQAWIELVGRSIGYHRSGQGDHGVWYA